MFVVPGFLYVMAVIAACRSVRFAVSCYGSDMAKVLGITGGIATGKSTVTEMLRELGALTFSADEIAREVLAPGSEGFVEVARGFGGDLVTPDGSLDRSRLAGIVFGDPKALEKLNSITHPRIIAEIERRIAQFRSSADGPDVLAVEIPLLVELDISWLVDNVVVVAAEQDEQLNRLTTRGYSAEESRQRLAAQLPISEKVRVADWIIHTDTSLSDTRAQVERMWRSIGGRCGSADRP